jgi:hypothetical protein
LARQALSVTTKRWRIIALSWWYRYVRFFCGICTFLLWYRISVLDLSSGRH